MKPLSQQSLFPAPYSDRDTSKAAAQSIHSHLQRLENKVLDVLEEWPPGLTSEEIEERTGLSGNTVRPRLVALRMKGMVEKTDQRHKTKSGRMAVLWKVR